LFGNMYYIDSDVHEEENLESNNFKSGAGDEDDETAAGLVADFSRWAADVSEVMMNSTNNKTTGYLSVPVPLEVKALPDAKPTLATECIRRSHQIGFKLKCPTAKSCTKLNQSQGSTHKSASIRHVVSSSSWTKQEQEKSSSPPKRARTWQEISAEINRFAEDNKRNAGWGDLVTYKKKAGEVDESLSFLSTQSLQAICKAETAFQDSLKSQQKLEEWDKIMGLRRCHSRTMAKSLVTRKKLLESLGALKLQKEMIKTNDGQVN